MALRTDHKGVNRPLDCLRILALYARHHSWLKLGGRLGKAAVRPIYESTQREIVHLSGDDVGRGALSEDVSELTRDRIDQMLEIMYVSRKELLARFDRGERCFAVLEHNHIISAFWSQVGLKDWNEMHLQFSLQPDQAWMYNAVTVKPARGRGLYPRIIRHMVDTLRQEGINQYYIDVQPENRASVRGLAKAGFTRIAMVTTRKVFSKSKYSVVVFDRSRWDQLARLIVNFDSLQWTMTEDPDHDGCPNPRCE